MLPEVALLVLLAVSPVLADLSDQTIRDALAIAAAPEARRKAFLRGYGVRAYDPGQGEQVTGVELFTPFREVVERAIREIQLNHSYLERRALEESRTRPPALRLLVRIRLPINAVPLESGVPFGSAYRVFVSYHAEGSGRQAVVVAPPVTLTQLCDFDLPCLLGQTIGGALLEASLPLTGSGDKQINLHGPLGVSVRGPAGRGFNAHFDLARLR